MEIIKINDIEYVTKKEYDLLLNKKDDEKDNSYFDKIEINLLDEVCIMGVGTVKLNESYKTVKISIEYLEKALKILSLITSKKGKREGVLLAIGNDSPLCIGDRKNNSFSGVIISPIIEGDD